MDSIRLWVSIGSSGCLDEFGGRILLFVEELAVPAEEGRVVGPLGKQRLQRSWLQPTGEKVTSGSRGFGANW